MGDAGVVDQPDQATAIEAGLDRPVGGVDRLGVGHVEEHRDEAVACGPPETLGRSLGPDASEDTMAEPVEVQGTRPSDPAGRAGHEHTT